MPRSTPSLLKPRFLLPGYWPTWVGVLLLWLVTRLPFCLQLRTGALLGWLALRLLPARRHIARTNLRLCFPEKNQADREALLRASFSSHGMGLIETALAWWGTDNRLRKRTTLVGVHHLRDALAAGKGAILLSAHLTSLEIGGRLLAAHVPFHVVYRPSGNGLFQLIMHRARSNRFERAIPKKDIRALLASLRAGTPVWYAPDQYARGSNSATLPFFGVPASTLTTTSRIARMSGAPVVPFFQMRLPNCRGYLLLLCPPLKGFPTQDLQADAARLNRLFEEVIREMPEQYLWVHRRFKPADVDGDSPY